MEWFKNQFLMLKHDKERINHYRDSYFSPLRHVSLSTVLYTVLQQSLPRSDIHSEICRGHYSPVCYIWAEILATYKAV